jgi:hypothetical protein
MKSRTIKVCQDSLYSSIIVNIYYLLVYDLVLHPLVFLYLYALLVSPIYPIFL